MSTLYIVYSNPQPYADSTDPRVYGTQYREDRYDFDDVSEAVMHSVSSYDDFQDHNAPQGFSWAGEFFSKCSATTRLSYVHDGSGGFTVVPQADSLNCGYVPPQPPSCDLGLTYQLTATGLGANVTATTTNAHSAVRYTLDDGPAQVSPTFFDLAPGRHVLAARDTALNGCVRTVAFTVATPPPPAAPAGAPEGIDFVLQPLWYQASAPAGAEVLLELYAERAHGAEDFRLVFRARKRADAAGRVSFRLDTLLAPLLSAVAPPRLATATVVCTAPLVNYFVRTATLLAPGRPATFVTSALRTALRGGLPAEHRALDYFAYRLEATGQPAFMSWKPAGQALTPAQPEWLFWLCPPSNPAVLIVRRSYVRTGFNDDAPLVENEQVNLGAGRGAFGRLLAIPVQPRTGMAAMSIALYDAAGEAVSGLLTYPIVPATACTRYIQFTNSLGGFDTLRTEGKFEGVLDGTAERYELPTTPLGELAERQTFDVSATRKLKLATGWLTAAQLAWLQELVLAREIWESQPGRLLPVDPAKRQLAYASDENPLRGLLLEYDYAFAVTAYANLS